MIQEINSKVFTSIEASDKKLNEIFGYEANSVNDHIQMLLNHGRVEVGYRSQCGSTHNTQKIFREFVKAVKLLRKQGLEISEEVVKHNNGYATNNGGFWNSTIYTLKPC